MKSIFLSALILSLTGCAQMQREEQERQAYIRHLDTVLAKSAAQRVPAYPYGYIPGVGYPRADVHIYIHK